MKTETLLTELTHTDVPTLKTINVPAVTVLYGNAMIPTGKMLAFDVTSFHQDANSSTIKVIRRDNQRKAIVQKFGDMPARIR